MYPRSRIVGSTFGLELTADKVYPCPAFMQQGDIFTVNARSAIHILIERLAPPTLWLPSYLCSAILEAVNQDITTVRFYAVDEKLRLERPEWLEEIKQGDMVVLIDYFGFPCDGDMANKVRDKGAWVLEDASQALLSDHVGQAADFVVFSPRKFLGVPDGGILRCRTPLPVQELSLIPPPAKWWLTAVTAGLLRKEFDRWGGSRRWLTLYQEAESSQPVGCYGMSQVTRELLLEKFDYPGIITRRLENYRILQDLLAEVALFPQINPGTVPLGFPVVLPRRDEVRQELFRAGIFPPVHWSLDKVVPHRFVASHKLASSIMTLPLDQRYGPEEMERMGEIIKKSL